MQLTYDSPPVGTKIDRDGGRWFVTHTTVDQVWIDAVGRPAPERGSYVLGSSSYRYTDEATARVVAIGVANIAAVEAILAAAGITAPYTREAYEHACALAGIEPMDDDAVDSYGARWGEYTLPHYPAEVCVQMTLAASRLAHLDVERAVPPNPNAGTPPVTGTCEHCGGEIHDHGGMVASLGLACGVDCYDALEG